jgi:hypothetical protein
VGVGLGRIASECGSRHRVAAETHNVTVTKRGADQAVRAIPEDLESGKTPEASTIMLLGAKPALSVLIENGEAEFTSEVERGVMIKMVIEQPGGRLLYARHDARQPADPRDCAGERPAVVEGLTEIGIVAKSAGADNIRNVTGSAPNLRLRDRQTR